MTNTLHLTDEETNLLYEMVREFQDRSSSYVFTNEETEEEEEDEERFLSLYNSIMDKLS